MSCLTFAMCHFADGRVSLWLCRQPVIHRHRQGVGGPDEAALLRRVQTRFRHHQLLTGIHHQLYLHRYGEWSAGGQVCVNDNADAVHCAFKSNFKYLNWKNKLTKDCLSLRRKSFFSGHASFSMFTMLYLAVSNHCTLPYTLSCSHTHAHSHKDNGLQIIEGVTEKRLGFDEGTHSLKKERHIVLIQLLILFCSSER